MLRRFALLLLLSFAPQAWSAPATGSWRFRVLLDDKPIGFHRFTLTQEGDVRVLRSEAEFDVKILFINAYRYRHEATERWRGDCLDSMQSRTDDDGTRLAVETKRSGERLVVNGSQGEEALEGCVMSFAYWNPAMLGQSRLLNAQTGEYEKVGIRRVKEENISVQGRQVSSLRYRVLGPKNPLDLWYAEDGSWLALQSTVGGGRRLSYRLE